MRLYATKRRRASRLALNRFNQDVDFSNYYDFLLQCGRFDRLCWQLVCGTFLAGQGVMVNDHLSIVQRPVVALQAVVVVFVVMKSQLIK